MRAEDVPFFDAAVRDEYLRWVAKVGPDDPYSGRNTIGVHEVLRAHFLILDFFSEEKKGEGVGGVGPMSVDLLHSALYRQFISLGGKEKWPDPLEKCATLLYGLAKDHAFHDANKRTAFLSTLLFLERLKRVPTIRQKEFEDFVVDIADSQLSKYPRFGDSKLPPGDAEVEFIAGFLRRNTRAIDYQTYSVTFHELNQILAKYGFELVSPKGNYIDVVRVDYKPKFLGILGPEVRHERRLAQIGFPGWKRIVTRQALKTVREATGLTPENGYDSRTFYHGADPLHLLIDTYAGPLKRLANR